MAILRTDFKTDLSDLLVKDIQFKKSNWYFFIGKSAGAQYGAPVSELTHCYADDLSIRSEAVYFKKVMPSNVSKSIKRYDWQAGTIYDKWDHTVDMTNKKFYVISKEDDLDIYRVYKCLDNGNRKYSLIKPTGNSYDVFRTGDGYLWKYMYEIPASRLKQFGDFTRMPIQKALSNSFYNKGQIDHVIISAKGNRYTQAERTQLVLNSTGHTTGIGAQLRVLTVTAGGAIDTVVVDSSGSNYTHGAKLEIISALGIGAAIIPVISGGAIIGVTVSSGGAGYAPNDIINVNVGGGKIIAKIDKDGHIFDTIIMESGGGYVSAPTISVVAENGEGSALYTENLPGPALLEAVVDQGKIVRVLIRDPGKNYPRDSATTISVTGDGRGFEAGNTTAMFAPVVYNGEIVDVIVDDPGQGYTYIALTVVRSGIPSPDDIEATIECIISAQDYESDQSVVEQVAIAGAIYSVNMTKDSFGNTIGADYTHAKNITVTFTGDGTGAEGVAVVDAGKIVDVVMTSGGKDYTFCDVSFTDSARVNLNDMSPNASGRGIIPPAGGHGFNAPKELYSDSITIYSILNSDQILNAISQDYRLFGLIRSPVMAASGKIFTKDSSFCAYTVTMTETIGLIKDEILIFDQMRYRVLYFTSTQVMLLPLQEKLITPIGILSAEQNSSRTYTSFNVNDIPLLDRFSGELVFASSEQPFMFDSNQSIIIKTTLSFQDN